MNTNAKSTRRDLLVTAARAACTVGLGAAAALLALRNGRIVCEERSACAGCHLRDGCDLEPKPGQVDSGKGGSSPR